MHTPEKVLNAVIWGNSYFKTANKNTIYFNNWINSGIIRVKDLKIENGNIDEEYIMRTVKKKHNYYCETLQLKQALRHYLGIIIKHVPNLDHSDNTTMYETSLTL